MQINRKPFLLPMGKQGWGLLVWGVWGVRMCHTAWKRQPFKWPHQCIQRRHWTTCYLPPPSPSSCRVPLLCLSKFLLSFHPFFSCFFLSPRWQRLELNRQPRQQLALWVGSGLASFINHSSVTGVTVLPAVTNLQMLLYSCAEKAWKTTARQKSYYIAVINMPCITFFCQILQLHNTSLKIIICNSKVIVTLIYCFCLRVLQSINKRIRSALSIFYLKKSKTHVTYDKNTKYAHSPLDESRLQRG